MAAVALLVAAVAAASYNRQLATDNGYRFVVLILAFI
jgi:hypothetical protein